MKNSKNSIFKKCMLGTGFTVLAFVLPLLKFYVLAPDQCLQLFKTLV